ncbi:Rhodanese-related sulfurtransferase [Formosa sp. Hel1_31_208]|uniref:rhodanese-like domain-containing protein n=1 Tax=Formosa sp. Hel1_31_208 TaxID=1798225 RepID=UPI00087CD3AE|nr:rhodanese-like domain-containing protein [Formosa sp. Hel1_31_208]SDS24525.1 Rhodanese-related sulfurtransferase [Formosa sp. Hel1_31_208]
MSILSSIFGKKTSQNDALIVLKPNDFRQQIEEKKVQLIDVRTPKEYMSGHIKGAKNIDFFSSKFTIEFNKLNQELPVYVYCRSGVRSRQAGKKLTKMGFIKIYDLKGGILNY